ncbi:MAG: EVE domain-containing protein [Aquificaceae bacterium]
MVDVEALEKLSKRVELKLLKKAPLFKYSLLIRIPHLSVIPITQEQAKRILELFQIP